MYNLTSDQLEELKIIQRSAKANADLGGDAAVGAYAPIYKFLLKSVDPVLATALDNQIGIDPSYAAAVVCPTI